MIAFIRRRPVGAFLLWFFPVGQAFAFVPVLAGDSLGPPELFIWASTLLGLLLPALVITRIVDGPGAVRDLLRRALHWRVGVGWYLLALVVVPLAAAAIVLLLAGPPRAFGPGVLAGLLLPHLLLPLALSLLPNNLWEELAWTGFVQARLQRRTGPVRAAVLTAGLFALQHVSLAVPNGLLDGALLLILLAVLSVPFRMLAGWIYQRTGSLLLVGIAHAAGNAVATGSGLGTGLLAELYPGQALATMAHLLAFAVIGLVVLAATRGRLGRGDGATSSPASPAPAPRSAPASPGSRTPHAAAVPGTAGSRPPGSRW